MDREALHSINLYFDLLKDIDILLLRVGDGAEASKEALVHVSYSNVTVSVPFGFISDGLRNRRSYLATKLKELGYDGEEVQDVR